MQNDGNEKGKRDMSEATTAAERKKLFKKVETFGSKPEDMTAAQRAQAITGYDLRMRIEALIAGITGKKIKTTFYGTGAATAEGIMILPTIPQARLFTREETQILLGYTAHEISHQLETDFEVFKSIFADIEKPTRRERQLKEWWNAIEDYRIEKITRREFPGFPIFIGATRHYTAERFVLAVESGNVMPGITDNPYRIGAVGLTWVGAILNGYPTQANDQALSLLDDDLEAWLRGTSDRLSRVESKKDALDLAEELLSELEDSQKDEDDQQDQGDQGDQGQQSQQNQNQPQQGGGQSDNGDSSDADSSDGGDGKEKDPESAGGKDEAGDAGDSDPSDGQSSGEEDESGKDGQSSGKDADGDDAEGGQDPDASESDGTEASGEGEEADDGDASEESSDQSDGDTDGEGEEDAQSDKGAGSDSGDDSDETDADSDKSSDLADDQGTEDSASSDGKESGEGSESDGDDGDDAASSGCEGSSTEAQSGEQDASSDHGDSGSESTGDAGKSNEGGNQAPAPRTTSDQADVEAEESDLTLDDILDQLAQIAQDMDNASVSVENDVGGREREEVQRSQRQYSELKRTIGSSGARTAGVVRRLLAARDQTRIRRNLEHGRLDLKRLVPIVNNSPNVYKEKTMRRDVNTAVSILVDNSISMGGHPIQVCQKAAIVLDSAITGTGTDLEITGFTGSDCNPVIYQYRRFGQRSQAAAASLGSMHQVSMGGTPVSVPILEAHRHLMAHKAPRKIMIIISDGEASDAVRAREAHDVALATGCIVLGIGIGPQGRAIGAWCTNHQVINDIDELPNALAVIVQQAMSPQARKAA